MKRIYQLLLILALCLGGTVYLVLREARQANREVRFLYCLDGDSFAAELNGEEIEIRMLAIDCPEKEDAYGIEARDFSKALLEKAEEIELVEENGAGKKDRYGRYLYWVYADGVLVQEELLENGLARVDYIFDSYKNLDELYAKEKIAKDNKIGIWSAEE
ncbi:MAG: thermonuclease family protein [Erysipelotrichaceae bacterium]|nr:thermonuclease family protein [Erysipelotrichaceae bacterium]